MGDKTSSKVNESKKSSEQTNEPASNGAPIVIDSKEPEITPSESQEKTSSEKDVDTNVSKSTVDLKEEVKELTNSGKPSEPSNQQTSEEAPIVTDTKEPEKII